jgi:hypothetical protein
MDNVYYPSLKQNDEGPEEGKNLKILYEIFTKTKKGKGIISSSL